MLKKMLIILITITVCLATTTFGDMTWSYGWEDGGTNFGSWNYPITENSTAQAHSGTHSLKITRGSGGTPQTYIWWVNGLQNGDTVTASIWIHASTGTNEAPRGRIWASYARSNDFTQYAGSAFGPNEYAGTPEWQKQTYTWTFDVGDPPRDALVIQTRVYDAEGDFIYIDDTEISVSRETADIMNANGEILPEPATIALILLPFLALLRKN